MALAAMALASAGRGQTAPAAPAVAPQATTYALVARLQVEPKALAMRYDHEPRLAGSPPNGAASVEIGAQARDAYLGAVRRMFRTDPGLETVELDVAIAFADLEARGGWWHAHVRHELVLRSASGDEVARWRVDGEARLAGFADGAVESSFAAAAQAAADRFEREFDGSTAVRTFLGQRGLAPRVVETRAPAPPPVRPDRGRLVGFLDGGLGVSTGDMAGATGVAVRGGVSARWFLAQFTFDAWQAAFAAAPPFGVPSGDASLQAMAAGLDVAGVFRVTRGLEVRGGIGAQFFSGRAEQRYVIQALDGTYVASRITIGASGGAANVFGGVVYAPRGRWLPRLGIEIRHLLQQPLQYDALQRDVAPSATSFVLLVGFEQNLGSARAE